MKELVCDTILSRMERVLPFRWVLRFPSRVFKGEEADRQANNGNQEDFHSVREKERERERARCRYLLSGNVGFFCIPFEGLNR